MLLSFDPSRGRKPFSAVIELLQSQPDLWARICRAVAAAIPNDALDDVPLSGEFSPKRMLGHGVAGIVYPTGSPRWIVKVTSEPDAGQIAAAIIRRRSLRSHPGVCFFRAVWHIPGVVLREMRDKRLIADRPVTVVVREELASVSLKDLPMQAVRFMGSANDWADVYNGNVRIGDRKVAEESAATYRLRLEQAAVAASELHAVTDFLLRYMREIGLALRDTAQPDNMGLHHHDMRDVGGAAPDESMLALRDIEQCSGLSRQRVAPLPR